MRRAERYEQVLNYFKTRMSKVTTELYFATPFQLLVATMLSAQCTDKRVNMVTPELFRRYPDAKSMAQADADDVLSFISSVSYPNAKSRHLVDMARKLVDNFGSEVPHDMASLVSLPGVGRKTANVVRAVAFGEAAMPVDTHVFRVSHRLGLVPQTAETPLAVEKVLTSNIPENLQADAHHWLLLHGRYVCTSRSPHCSDCPFETFCPSAVKNNTKGSGRK